MARPLRLAAMELALAMGRVNVDAMLDEISIEQFREWRGFRLLRPFGDEWRQAGMIAAAAFNANPYKKKPLMPEDFMPPTLKPPKRQSNDEITRKLQGWTALYGVKPSGQHR